MESRLGILLALSLMAVAVVVPLAGADAGDTGDFSYKSQLDDNALLVYKEVGTATSITDTTRSFEVQFVSSNLFNNEEDAKTYAEYTVSNALSALYLSNPMVPYIWNFPCVTVEVDPEISKVEVTSSTSVTTTYYVVDTIRFDLSVPEGITSDSIKELEDAISAINITGSTDAKKVKSIITYLDNLRFQQDEEGTVSNIYDALVTKKTTSAGVAQAFVQLCTLNDIKAFTVCGDNLLTSKEDISYWNIVYLEGDIDGVTTYSWYLVDSAYCADTGIAGYATEIVDESKTYSMSAVHNKNLKLIGDNGLDTPQTAKDSYVQVGGPSFIELYGEKILLGALAVVMAVGMLYAVRSGNY